MTRILKVESPVEITPLSRGSILYKVLHKMLNELRRRRKRLSVRKALSKMNCDEKGNRLFFVHPLQEAVQRKKQIQNQTEISTF